MEMALPSFANSMISRMFTSSPLILEAPRTWYNMTFQSMGTSVSKVSPAYLQARHEQVCFRIMWAFFAFGGTADDIPFVSSVWTSDADEVLLFVSLVVRRGEFEALRKIHPYLDDVKITTVLLECIKLRQTSSWKRSLGAQCTNRLICCLVDS